MLANVIIICSIRLDSHTTGPAVILLIHVYLTKYLTEHPDVLGIKSEEVVGLNVALFIHSTLRFAQFNA